jgi:hypothetical protein
MHEHTRRLALLRKGKPAWNKGLGDIYGNNKPWPYTQQTKDRISESMKAYWASDAGEKRKRGRMGRPRFQKVEAIAETVNKSKSS